MLDSLQKQLDAGQRHPQRGYEFPQNSPNAFLIYVYVARNGTKTRFSVDTDQLEHSVVPVELVRLPRLKPG